MSWNVYEGCNIINFGEESLYHGGRYVYSKEMNSWIESKMGNDINKILDHSKVVLDRDVLHHLSIPWYNYEKYIIINSYL